MPKWHILGWHILPPFTILLNVSKCKILISFCWIKTFELLKKLQNKHKVCVDKINTKFIFFVFQYILLIFGTWLKPSETMALIHWTIPLRSVCLASRPSSHPSTTSWTSAFLLLTKSVWNSPSASSSTLWLLHMTG